MFKRYTLYHYPSKDFFLVTVFLLFVYFSIFEKPSNLRNNISVMCVLLKIIRICLNIQAVVPIMYLCPACTYFLSF